MQSSVSIDRGAQQGLCAGLQDCTSFDQEGQCPDCVGYPRPEWRWVKSRFCKATAARACFDCQPKLQCWLASHQHVTGRGLWQHCILIHMNASIALALTPQRYLCLRYGPASGAGECSKPSVVADNTMYPVRSAYGIHKWQMTLCTPLPVKDRQRATEVTDTLCYGCCT